MDTLLSAADTALRTLFAQPHAAHPCPTVPDTATELTAQERSHAASLMRVNHVGEVCAQALYTAQALATKNEALRAHYTKACIEEADHLAWTAQRLEELGVAHCNDPLHEFNVAQRQIERLTNSYAAAIEQRLDVLFRYAGDDPALKKLREIIREHRLGTYE